MGYILPLQNAEHRLRYKQFSKAVIRPQPVQPMNRSQLDQEFANYLIRPQQEPLSNTNQESIEKIIAKLTGKGRNINELI